MKDFGDDEYPNMICVEAGHVTSPVLLHPGTTFEASQILQVKMLDKKRKKKVAKYYVGKKKLNKTRILSYLAYNTHKTLKKRL
jgi:Uncharacterized enzymes related to aldose 1-epimerase